MNAHFKFKCDSEPAGAMQSSPYLALARCLLVLQEPMHSLAGKKKLIIAIRGEYFAAETFPRKPWSLFSLYERVQTLSASFRLLLFSLITERACSRFC